MILASTAGRSAPTARDILRVTTRMTMPEQDHSVYDARLLAAEQAYGCYIDGGGDPNHAEALRLIEAADRERQRIRKATYGSGDSTSDRLNGVILDPQAYQWRAGRLPAMLEWVSDGYSADDIDGLERLVEAHLDAALAQGARMVIATTTLEQ